jgi:hypothetical protein
MLSKFAGIYSVPGASTGLNLGRPWTAQKSTALPNGPFSKFYPQRHNVRSPASTTIIRTLFSLRDILFISIMFTAFAQITTVRLIIRSVFLA